MTGPDPSGRSMVDGTGRAPRPPAPRRGREPLPLTGRGPAVLVVVGTDAHPFDRLMEWLERWYAARADRPRLTVQHGSSRSPLLPGARPYLGHDELQRAMRETLLVVCHGGPATISEARRSRHLPIVVPRDPARAEHVDDHQVLFTRRLARIGAIRLCESEPAFASALDTGLADPARFALAAGAEEHRTEPAETAARIGRIVEDLVTARYRRREERRR